MLHANDHNDNDEVMRIFPQPRQHTVKQTLKDYPKGPTEHYTRQCSEY